MWNTQKNPTLGNITQSQYNTKGCKHYILLAALYHKMTVNPDRTYIHS